MLKASNPTIFNDSNSIIDGYYFEAAIHTKLEKLVVTYTNQEKRRSKLANFEITVHLEQRDSTPLRALKEGCLYRLRGQHPVIDYVAVLTVTISKQHWLLLLQVSLSKYTDHTAKAGDLKRNVKGPEMGKEQTTWLQYYQALAKTCLATPTSADDTFKTMYVYISPKEIATEGGKNQCAVLIESGQKSRTKGLYLGLIYENSCTHKPVKETLVTL